MTEAWALAAATASHKEAREDDDVVVLRPLHRTASVEAFSADGMIYSVQLHQLLAIIALLLFTCDQ
jgi:hypothetical protein